MATSRRRISFQLYDGSQAAAMRGLAITASGGAVMVCTAGSPDKVAITDKDGTALNNPLALTNGSAELWTLATVNSVDLYIQAPGGQWKIVTGVNEGNADIAINVNVANQLYVIPFSISDSVAATEKDTGFDLPTYSMVLGRLSGCGIKVTALDATEDIDVGILSTESGGDADGLIAASDLDNLGLVIGTNGALFSTNAPHKADAVTGKSISYTLTTGTDTAKGFILLPVVLDIAGA